MSLDKLQVCIALPQAFPDGKVDMDLIRHYCTRAEDLGYHGLWTQEQILGSTAVLDPLSLLTYATALTSRVELGVSVLVLPLHNPVQLAKQVSSMDQMSGGRLVLGVGLGGATGNYPAFGIGPEVRVRRFLEIIGAMRALWSDGAASYEGTFYKLNDVSMEPKPVSAAACAHLVRCAPSQLAAPGGEVRRFLDGGGFLSLRGVQRARRSGQALP